MKSRLHLAVLLIASASCTKRMVREFAGWLRITGSYFQKSESVLTKRASGKFVGGESVDPLRSRVRQEGAANSGTAAASGVDIECGSFGLNFSSWSMRNAAGGIENELRRISLLFRLLRNTTGAMRR